MREIRAEAQSPQRMDFSFFSFHCDLRRFARKSSWNGVILNRIFIFFDRLN